MLETITTLKVHHELVGKHSLYCRETPHVHRWGITLSLRGKPSENGMIVNLLDVENYLQMLVEPLQSTFLNEKFPSPTCEVIAKWVFERTHQDQPKWNVHQVEVRLKEQDGSEWGSAIVEAVDYTK